MSFLKNNVSLHFLRISYTYTRKYDHIHPSHPHSSLELIPHGVVHMPEFGAIPWGLTNLQWPHPQSRMILLSPAVSPCWAGLALQAGLGPEEHRSHSCQNFGWFPLVLVCNVSAKPTLNYDCQEKNSREALAEALYAPEPWEERVRVPFLNSRCPGPCYPIQYNSSEVLSKAWIRQSRGRECGMVGNRSWQSQTLDLRL